MLFTESQLRATARDAEQRLYKSAKGVIDEACRRAAGLTQFDIFMSHPYLDKELIAGLVLEIERLGHSVYVDWVYDHDLNRKNVARSTAQRLRSRMATSRCLFYATTKSASKSKWMPWECGFMDGLKHRVATCPIVNYQTSSFEGQEYLSLYPYVQKNKIEGENKEALWIHESPTKYMIFSQWLKGSEPTERGK